MMNKEDTLQFLNTNPVCHLATIEGNQPRVRGMLMHKADSTGITLKAFWHRGSLNRSTIR